LAFGSSTLPKNVLEYVVFERHLTSPYGVWRVHDKIIPSWMPPQTPVIRSYIMPKLYKIDEEAEKKIESKFKKDDSHLPAEETAEEKAKNIEAPKSA
jgi:large subunit ribosomal protein L45